MAQPVVTEGQSPASLDSSAPSAAPALQPDVVPNRTVDHRAGQARQGSAYQVLKHKIESPSARVVVVAGASQGSALAGTSTDEPMPPAPVTDVNRAKAEADALRKLPEAARNGVPLPQGMPDPYMASLEQM